MFEALAPGYAEEFPTIDPRRVLLSAWSAKGLDLDARFVYLSHGEVLDAEVLRAALEDLAQARGADVSLREREVLVQLQKKYPEMAQAAAAEAQG